MGHRHPIGPGRVAGPAIKPATPKPTPSSTIRRENTGSNHQFQNFGVSQQPLASFCCKTRNPAPIRVPHWLTSYFSSSIFLSCIAYTLYDIYTTCTANLNRSPMSSGGFSPMPPPSGLLLLARSVCAAAAAFVKVAALARVVKNIPAGSCPVISRANASPSMYPNLGSRKFSVA
jgi:hypothetical protein